MAAVIWVASSRVGASTRPVGCFGPAAAAVEAADQGQGEGQRLAAAGLAAAEHVAAGQGVGQGFGLDGEGVVDAACREGGDEWFAHAEVGEGRVYSRLGSSLM